MAVRYLEGGRARFIEFVQQAALNGATDAKMWLAVYADLKRSEREAVSFDDVCAGAGVRPSDLMSTVVSTAMELHTDIGNLVAAALKPKVIHQLGKSALRIGGAHEVTAQRDRQLFLQSTGFAPVPKGAVTNVNVHALASANASAAAKASSEPSVPSFSDDMARLDEVREQIQGEIIDADTEDAD